MNRRLSIKNPALFAIISFIAIIGVSFMLVFSAVASSNSASADNAEAAEETKAVQVEAVAEPVTEKAVEEVKADRSVVVNVPEAVTEAADEAEDIDNDSEAPAADSALVAFINEDQVNFRSEPDSEDSSNIIYVLHYGSVHKVVETGSEWTLIDVDGFGEGYVYSSCIILQEEGDITSEAEIIAAAEGAEASDEDEMGLMEYEEEAPAVEAEEEVVVEDTDDEIVVEETEEEIAVEEDADEEIIAEEDADDEVVIEEDFEEEIAVEEDFEEEDEIVVEEDFEDEEEIVVEEDVDEYSEEEFEDEDTDEDIDEEDIDEEDIDDEDTEEDIDDEDFEDEDIDEEDADEEYYESSDPYASLRQEIVDYACSFAGWLPYVWGSHSLTYGADCSGFTHAIYAQFGYDLSCDSEVQSRQGYSVPVSEILPGDIIVYSGHVAMYVGDGLKVHSPYPGTVVTIDSMYYSTILDVRRIIG